MEVKKTKGTIGKKTKTLLILLCLFLSLFVVCFFATPVQAETTNIVTVECGTNDGYIWDQNIVYATLHDQATGSYVVDTSTQLVVGQRYYDSTYRIFRGFIYFDTSFIPDDATIDNATLSLNVSSVPTSDWNLTIQNGQPTYPHTPIASGDYYYGYYSGNGGNISTSEMSVNTRFNITLEATGLDWLDLDGTTKLALLSDADLNETAPTTEDMLILYSTEYGTESAPKLYIGYTIESNYVVNLYGPYTEDGLRNYDGINCTFTRPTQAPLTFELNGTYGATAETDTRLVIVSDVGGNYSRVYYLRYDQWYEDIYVFYPDSLFTTYYVTLADYVGVTNGYLESILNVNGTDRIIERQRADVTNEIPFVLSWGTSYKFRLICDEGTYTWQSIVAGGDTTFSLVISSIIFPPDSIHISDITLSATRVDDITIQALYDDDAELTDWVYISFTELGETTPTYETNNTGNTQNITWSDAVPSKNYVVYFEISHQEEGTLTYSIVVPTIADETNPWDFSWMGDWGGIDSTQLIAFIIVIGVFGAFSIGSVDVGIVATLITAAILILIGWLNIEWTFFAFVFCIAILMVISIRKSQQGAG